MTTATNKHRIESLISDYLSQQEEIVFVYLFGSFVNDGPFRDIDTAVYTAGKPGLIKFGTMQTELSGRAGREVELVPLNSLPDKKPALAYNVVTAGKLLFTHDPELHTAYKRKALLYYFDTARLREQVDRAFEKRLESDRFGQRDYV